MGKIFKYLGNKEQARELWENREALDKYLARLKELMEEDEKNKEIKKPGVETPGLSYNPDSMSDLF